LVSVDQHVSVLLLGASQIIGDGAMMVYWINEISLRQMIVPTHLLGRVNASFGFLGEGVAPFGALVAGALGSTLGVQPALWISVTGILCTALMIAASPVRRFRAIPTIIVGESAGS
ncbi:MAG: MFS transporter, partial [Anaerolineae bacterium]